MLAAGETKLIALLLDASFAACIGPHQEISRFFESSNASSLMVPIILCHSRLVMPPVVPRASVHLLHTSGRRPGTKQHLACESFHAPFGRTDKSERIALAEVALVFFTVRFQRARSRHPVPAA